MDNTSLMRINGVGIEMFHKHGISINRPRGSGDFVFIHFLTPAYIVLDKVKRRLEPDACIVYAPPKAQRYHSLLDTPFGNNWMHFAGRTCIPFLKSLAIPLNTPFTPHVTSFIAPCLRQMHGEKVRKESYWQMNIDAKLRAFLVELARGNEAKNGDEARTHHIREEMLQLRTRLVENCQEPWSVGKMARIVHLSDSRFSVIYRKLFGASPMSDLLRIRMDLAKFYLGMTHMTIEEVAEGSGFASVNYFHRQFKKMNGMPPRQFQRSFTGEDLRPPSP